MIITCEACGTSFKIKSSLIKETGSTVRCSKCQQVFIAYPKSAQEDKPTDFSIDESLESKIDDVLGSEFDDDEFSDLESEISLETAEITMSTSEELFDTGVRNLDLDNISEEPEIMMSDLEQDDDIISLDSLAEAGSGTEEVDLGALLADDEDESGELSLSDLGAKATAEDESEIFSFEDTDQEEEISFDNLESTADQDADEIGLDELESGEVAKEEFISSETIEETTEDKEEGIDFLDFEDEEVQPKDDVEMETEEAEPEEIMEGGVDTDLDEFDLEKESEEEDTSEGTAKDAGKEEAEKPAEEMSKSETDEEDLDLDFELDLEEDASEEAAAIETEEEDFELDLDATTDAEAAEEASIEEEDLGLDLEGFEDLDLTESPSEEIPAEEDLGLDIGSTAETEEDLGLDLDMDEFADLDLDLGVDEDELTSDDAGDADLDLDLEEGEAGEVATATAEEEEFDLDFDLDEAVDEKAEAKEETFELDLNIEPEPEEAEAESEDFDLDLDFEDDLGDISSAGAETFMDDDAGSVTQAEEFDLTQIEDVLDFDEMPEPEEGKAATAIDDLEMDLEESEPDTVSDEDEMSIDLETMLDEEEQGADEKKEVSLETVEEREQQIEQDYKKTVVEEREAPAAMREEIPEPEEDFGEETIVSAPTPAAVADGRERNLKKILIPVILLIVLAAAIIIGLSLFGGKEEVKVPVPPPAVTDQGNLRIEMSATPAYKFVENQTSGELLVITGNVVNRYDHPRSNVLVKGTLYDNAGKVIVSSSAYSGNMFTDEELATLPIETIKERMNNRMGDSNLNENIAAGNKIPFTVIFSELPENIYEFTAEVVQSVK